MRPNYFFNNPDDLVNHILTKFPDEPWVLRLNLTLYFLFVTYAAAYNPENEIEYDLSEQPRFVADLTFTADKYGPQDYSVKEKLKNEYYQPKEYPFQNNQVDQNVKWFIDDILNQLKDVDDFSLVDRTHQDNAWFNAYYNTESKIMSKDQMILDYQY
jgi:hypothetical protein